MCRIYLYTVHCVVLCNYFHLHRHLHRIVRAGLTLSEGTRHIRARDKRFYFFFFSFLPFREQGKARREKREWRHFFLARSSLSKTKRNSRALVRSFARSLVRSFRRLFSSPSSRSIGYSPPSRRLAEISSPSSSCFSTTTILASDLPMEARSRDKLGQPIGIKSGRIGTPRPRFSPLSFPFSRCSSRNVW